MINSFFEVTQYSGFDYAEYLEKLNILRIFEPIFKEYEDPDLCKKVIKYIAYTHSMESDKLSIGGDRRKEISKVFKDLQIANEYYEELVLLKNTSVIKSVQRWMDYKDNRQIEYLFTLQNAYVQQQAASLKDILKATSEVDYDQKMRCIEHMTELKKMIKDAESELQQNHEKLKEGYKEVSKAAKKNTASVEDFLQ
jgi:hypothetical protein